MRCKTATVVSLERDASPVRRAAFLASFRVLSVRWLSAVGAGRRWVPLSIAAASLGQKRLVSTQFRTPKAQALFGSFFTPVVLAARFAAYSPLASVDRPAAIDAPSIASFTTANDR